MSKVLEIDKLLDVMGKYNKLGHITHLECIKTVERQGDVLFTEGTNYKVRITYGNNFLLITDSGNGHGVTNEGKFMKEHFKEM